jgi:hypothetical protein
VGDLTADTEVREQNSPLRGTRGHKNVGRLHIAVKQTPLMCKTQGVGDRINDRHDVYETSPQSREGGHSSPSTRRDRNLLETRLF